VGALAAQMFDEIIIRHDEDLRGRTAEEMTTLLTQGARQAKPDIGIRVISDENSALAFAISNAVPGSFITTLTESVYEAIAFVQHSRDIYRTQQVVAQV
jgi:cyanophycin synthetase